MTQLVKADRAEKIPVLSGRLLVKIECIFANIIREKKFTTLDLLSQLHEPTQWTTLRKAYNWLKSHDLIPVDLPKFSTAQTQSHLKKVSNLYVKGSRLYETLLIIERHSVFQSQRYILKT